MNTFITTNRGKTLAIAVVFLLGASLALPGKAAVEHIEQYNVNMTVQDDGVLRIEERILYDFGNTPDRHGIYRTIPTSVSIGGGTLTQDFTVDGITDDQGNKQPYTQEGSNPLQLRIGDPNVNVSGQRWYVMTYTVTPSVLLYSETAELTWDAIGTEWQVPINQAAVTVTIPEGGDTQLQRALCYTGVYGSTFSSCTATVESETTFTYIAENMSSDEGLTVRAVFDGAVAPQASIVSMSTIESLDVAARLTVDNTLVVEEQMHTAPGQDVSAPIQRQISTVFPDANSAEVVSQVFGLPDTATLGTQWTTVTTPSSPVPQTTTLQYTVISPVTTTSSEGADNNDIATLAWMVIPPQHQQTILSLNTIIALPEGIDTATAACTLVASSQPKQLCRAVVTNGTVQITARDIRAGQGVQMEALLLPNVVTPPAEVTIAAVNPNLSADITIDNVSTGQTTPRTFRLTQGEHSITLAAHKQNDVTMTVDATDQARQIISVPFEKSLLWIILDMVVPIVTAVAGVVLLFLVWYRYGRDPKGRGTIVHEYDAPKGLSPAEVGVVVDRRVDMRDIASTIIDLAVRGYLTIVRDEKVKHLKDPEAYTLKNNTRPTQELKPHELATLAALFPANETERNLSDFKFKFYTHLPGLKKALYTAVTAGGYFPSRPDRVRHISIAVGWVAMVGLGALSGFASVSIGSVWYLLWAGVGVVAFITAFFMPKRTRVGALAAEHIQGYKQFLKVVEQDRLKALYSPKNFQQLFEKHLPFAIALEVEQEWAEHFKGMFTENPRWISGVNVTDAVVFSSVLHGFTAAANSTFAASPSSSGGGVGFSGGGFGGGGGGSW